LLLLLFKEKNRVGMARLFLIVVINKQKPHFTLNAQVWQQSGVKKISKKN